MMTPAPRLETRDLVLRGPEKRDLAPFTQWVTTSSRMAHVGGNGSAQDAWRGFIAGIGHWQWHGYGFFTLEDRATGQTAGRVGLLNHVEWPAPELAWHLFDGYEGRSLAYQAACAVRYWAGTAFGLSSLISLIAPENARSAALAQRLGASAGEMVNVGGENVVIFTHLAHDDPRAQHQLAEVTA